MKKLIFPAFLFASCMLALTGFRSDADVPKNAAIQWLTIEQAYAKMQLEPRKILIDVYTDWCGWCKVMDRETFKNPKVAQYINEKFYAVKFNAEQTKPVILGNLKFEYLPENRVHQLALSLTNNQPSYPTTVFLDDQFQMIQPLPGYMKAREFHEVITFFGENYHKKEAFEDYKTKIYPTLFAVR
ncbi:Thiol:disulfide interchange protein DsbD [Dyadobacter sp. CECT 9275]|uniref:Thiol:disulfide interchange protein DsbD n=1 Tax=Dyadobacter helix TaxID=2822344 RepID=A0A916JH06_9BACT|nr:DUF255 domain-containing protein [Dyadobacter sp. CECT 9275]CAG5012652.1 Thiol:disulfide interchange protein DsbD [Dyadobacter sp. CECT 9275]